MPRTASSSSACLLDQRQSNQLITLPIRRSLLISSQWEGILTISSQQDAKECIVVQCLLVGPEVVKPADHSANQKRSFDFQPMGRDLSNFQPIGCQGHYSSVQNLHKLIEVVKLSDHPATLVNNQPMKLSTQNAMNAIGPLTPQFLYEFIIGLKKITNRRWKILCVYSILNIKSLLISKLLSLSRGGAQAISQSLQRFY